MWWNHPSCQALGLILHASQNEIDGGLWGEGLQVRLCHCQFCLMMVTLGIWSVGHASYEFC